MCSDGYQPDDEAVGECGNCGSKVDKDGDSVEHQCNYSPESCSICRDHPCDESC